LDPKVALSAVHFTKIKNENCTKMQEIQETQEIQTKHYRETQV
jgi:hypothetical protein